MLAVFQAMSDEGEVEETEFLDEAEARDENCGEILKVICMT